MHHPRLIDGHHLGPQNLALWAMPVDWKSTDSAETLLCPGLRLPVSRPL